VSERAAGVATAAAAAILFGSSYVATAFQLRGFSPIAGAFWRSALAAVAIVVVSVIVAMRRRGLPRVEPPPAAAGRLARLLVLGLLGGCVFLAGMNVAVALIGATITSFVAGLYAILAALFAPVVLGERVEPRAVAGFVVALVGTALLAELAPTGDTLGGLVAGGMAAVSYGLYLVLIRRWSRAIQAGPLAVTLANTGMATAGLGAFILLRDPSSLLPHAMPPDVVVATAWLVLVSAGGTLLVTAALRRVEARLVSSMLLLNPVTATILAAMLLAETPTPPQLAGGLLVLAGMAASSDVVGLLRRWRRSARPGVDAAA
jgi:drug/metabolite transporter, DME family